MKFLLAAPWALRLWVVSLFLILCQVLWLLGFAFDPDVPEIVPIHFNLQGQPDAYGSWHWLWLLPGCSLFVLAVITFAMRYTWTKQKLNMPVREEHKMDVLRFAMVWMSSLMAVTMLFTGYILFTSVRLIRGHGSGLGTISVILFLVINMLMAIGGLYLMQEINAGRKKWGRPNAEH